MNKKLLSSFIGLEITGASTQELLSDRVSGELVRDLQQHDLLVIRDQHMTPFEQVAFARHFGRPVPFLMSRYHHPEHAEIMLSSNEERDGVPLGVARVGNFWHLDSSFVAEPAAFTLLFGKVVPNTSGDTLFSNAAHVYERLPQEWKTRIQGRTALHTVNKRHRIGPEHVGLSIAEFRDLTDQKYPKVRHPLVKQDPHTGRTYLYAASEYLDSVDGFDSNENAAFMAMLDELVADPAHVYTHCWKPGDLLLWKTQTALHAATAVAPGLKRTVHRVSIEALAA